MDNRSKSKCLNSSTKVLSIHRFMDSQKFSINSKLDTLIDELDMIEELRLTCLRAQYLILS